MVWFGLTRQSQMQEIDVRIADLVRYAGTRTVDFVIVSLSRIG
jgi:hypothetical protein